MRAAIVVAVDATCKLDEFGAEIVFSFALAHGVFDLPNLLVDYLEFGGQALYFASSRDGSIADGL